LVGFGALAGLSGGGGFACGYSPVLGAQPKGGLSVRLLRSLIAEPLVSRELVTGAESYLAELGALEDGGSAALELVVLRLDETPAAVRLGGSSPKASGVSMRLTARAQVLSAGRVEASAELSRSVELGVGPGMALARDAGLTRVARLLGRELAAHVLGLPTPERG